MARTSIADIESRGARPVLVGGTGVYIQSLLTSPPLRAPPLAPDRAAAIDFNAARHRLTAARR